MPGREEFREAAGRCARLGESVARMAAQVHGWRVEAHIGAGPVAAAVSEQLALVAAELRVAAEELADISRGCWQRSVDPDDLPERRRR